MATARTLIAAIALLGWIPIVLALFVRFPARRAIIIGVVAGMLFLPEAAFIRIPLITYSKQAAISLSVVLGILLFDFKRLQTFRFHWYDTFAVLSILIPIQTSVLNDLGVKDGIVETLSTSMIWLVPYFVGRLYFTDYEALREAAIAVFVGGIVYMPLCLIETQLSPQLHRWVYGFHAHEFLQTYRWGGFRPTVFMQHGLAVGSFMACATLAGFVLWLGGSLRSILWMPMWFAVCAMIVVTILCKSTGAIGMLAAGLVVATLAMKGRTAIPLLVMIALPCLYVTARLTHLFDGRAIVSAAAESLNEDRAASFKFRLDNEDPVIDLTMQRPWFGWGGWDRSRMIEPRLSWDMSLVERKAVLDGLWIITFGKRGILGLVLFFAVFFTGPTLFRWRVPARMWSHPAIAPTFACVMFLVLHLVDCVPNAMPLAIAYYMAGGLAGLIPVRQVMQQQQLQHQQMVAARMFAVRQQMRQQRHAPAVSTGRAEAYGAAPVMPRPAGGGSPTPPLGL